MIYLYCSAKYVFIPFMKMYTYFIRCNRGTRTHFWRDTNNLMIEKLMKLIILFRTVQVHYGFIK